MLFTGMYELTLEKQNEEQWSYSKGKANPHKMSDMIPEKVTDKNYPCFHIFFRGDDAGSGREEEHARKLLFDFVKKWVKDYINNETEIKTLDRFHRQLDDKAKRELEERYGGEPLSWINMK